MNYEDAIKLAQHLANKNKITYFVVRCCIRRQLYELYTTQNVKHRVKAYTAIPVD